MNNILESSRIKPIFNVPILEIHRLNKTFIVKRGLFSKKHLIRAVNNVSFTVYEGETLGLIGESGSGKTTLSHLIMGLNAFDSGSIKFMGIDEKHLRRDVQIVFQYTYGALDPLKTVYDLIKEPLVLHNVNFEGTIDDEIGRLLNMVGLSEGLMHRKTGAISGGQKQRVGIARAIASKPKFLVLDEPVSALDISVQGQIVNLLWTLKQSLGLTYLFITHDLMIAKHLSDRLAVMHRGEIIEIGETHALLNNPKMPYTKKLFSSVK